MAKTSTKKAGLSSERAGSSTGPDLAFVEKVLRLMAKHQVVELEWGNGQESLRLKTQAAIHSGSATSAALPSGTASGGLKPALLQAASAGEASAKPQALHPNRKQVLSPFVGTFYRAPAPDADPYVSEGQTVKPGEVLCIIEAMKLMNEIESEFNGKILSILVENGQPVEFGEPLFVVET